MEVPDDEELDEALDGAIKGPYGITADNRKAEEAGLLQNQRLINDIGDTNETIQELNNRLDSYTTWSRRLTITLVILGLLSLCAQAVLISLRMGYI